MLLCVDTDTANKSIERYFVTFTRKNPLISVTKGEVTAINCPHCGGNLDFGGKVLSVCPYCNNTVAVAEYDWVLSAVERVTDNTTVINRSVIKTTVDE